MALTTQQVRDVANLARLRLTDDEVNRFATQLGQILDYVAMLDDLDTEAVEPMVHAFEMSNVFREDQVRESLPRDQSLKNAPKTDGKYFLVPQVIDQRGR